MVVPSNLVELEDQLKIFGGVCSIIFDTRNPISKGIKRLLRDFNDFSCEFESLMETDDQFAAKILFSVDSRIQRFLMQCKRCHDREDVNDNLVNFAELSEDCLNQSFNISLPPAFQISGAPKQDQKEKENKRKRTNDRGGGKEREKADFVPNDDQEEAFKLKVGESYKDLVVNKLISDIPHWEKEKHGINDCRMCKRFHIRGLCFSDCPNAASHVAKGAIPNDRKEAMKSWMKRLRKL